MTTITIHEDEYYLLIKERDMYKKHCDLLEKHALERSVEFEQMRKIAESAIAELTKVQKMVEATIL